MNWTEVIAGVFGKKPASEAKLMHGSVGQTTVEVIHGDIRTVSGDAIITAINSGKAWFGGIDRAIQSVAGGHYHRQAAMEELADLKTVVALGNRKMHRGAFDNVVFVVDDLESKLRDVVFAGLEAADEVGFKTVTIPGLRLGMMAGVVEKSIHEVFLELDTGTVRYLRSHPKTNLRSIKFVLLAPGQAPIKGLPEKWVVPVTSWPVTERYLLGMQKQRPLPSGSVTANSRSPQV
jgi:hypothetical protein